MSQSHIALMMHDSLHRGVERDSTDLLRFGELGEFYMAKSKPYFVNLVAYALGKLQLNDNWTEMQDFERADLLKDRTLYRQLASILDRMPTVHFQLIPLVMLVKQELQTTFLLRVRSTSLEDYVYLDLTNRKYDTFEDFLTSNTLPACTLWYPRDGRIRYANTTSIPMLTIEKRQIERNAGAWQILSATGVVVGSALSLTPLAPTVGLPLLFVSTAISSGFSIAQLIDGCKHERGTVIATRAAALAFSLTSFASTGLTVACRVEKVRRLIPAEQLVKLERAEQLLGSGIRKMSTVGVVTTVIGSLRGWETLSSAELLELGAMLCFAYRADFTWANAERLIHTLQLKGVVKFFATACPNVPSSVLRAKIGGPSMEYYLRLFVEFLQNQTDFKVNDQFVTITLFGYEMRFEQLFKIRWSEVMMLLQYLQASKQTVGNVVAKATKPWTQSVLNDVLKLLQVAGRLKDFPCTLADYITLGPGHRFSFATLRDFFGAKDLYRYKLLEQLALFSSENAERLNQLRETGRFEGGDLALFNWLGRHSSDDYFKALTVLLELAACRESTAKRKLEPFKFEEKRIIVSPLLAIEIQEFLRVPLPRRELLVRDDRFLKLCNDVNENLRLRANSVWIRSCSGDIDTVSQLETVGLLQGLLQGLLNDGALKLQLAGALADALDIADCTVPQVYYRMLFIWKQCTTIPLDKRTMLTRFQSLLDEAQKLQMIGYYSFRFKPDDSKDDEAIIAKVRTMLPRPVPGINSSIPFGTPERAACWLGLLPVLRNASFRVITYQAFVDLLATGHGTVMQQSDQAIQQYVFVPEKKMIQFANGNQRVIIEVLLPKVVGNFGSWRASFYLCGSSFN